MSWSSGFCEEHLLSIGREAVPEHCLACLKVTEKEKDATVNKISKSAGLSHSLLDLGKEQYPFDQSSQMTINKKVLARGKNPSLRAECKY